MVQPGSVDFGASARKAALAQEIRKTLRARKLTRAAAAGLLGIDGPEVVRLLRGQAEQLPEDLLLRLMARLGRNITITVGPLTRIGLGTIELNLYCAEEVPPRAHNRLL